MIVRIQLFAGMKQKLGQAMIEIDIPEATTIAELRTRIARDFPDLETALAHSRFAIGNDYAEETAIIPGDSALACIPPVSGG